MVLRIVALVKGEDDVERCKKFVRERRERAIRNISEYDNKLVEGREKVMEERQEIKENLPRYEQLIREMAEFINTTFPTTEDYVESLAGVQIEHLKGKLVDEVIKYLEEIFKEKGVNLAVAYYQVLQTSDDPAKKIIKRYLSPLEDWLTFQAREYVKKYIGKVIVDEDKLKKKLTRSEVQNYIKAIWSIIGELCELFSEVARFESQEYNPKFGVKLEEACLDAQESIKDKASIGPLVLDLVEKLHKVRELLEVDIARLVKDSEEVHPIVAHSMLVKFVRGLIEAFYHADKLIEALSNIQLDIKKAVEEEKIEEEALKQNIYPLLTSYLHGINMRFDYIAQLWDKIENSLKKITEEDVEKMVEGIKEYLMKVLIEDVRKEVFSRLLGVEMKSLDNSEIQRILKEKLKELEGKEPQEVIKGNEKIVNYTPEVLALGQAKVEAKEPEEIETDETKIKIEPAEAENPETVEAEEVKENEEAEKIEAKKIETESNEAEKIETENKESVEAKESEENEADGIKIKIEPVE